MLPSIVYSDRKTDAGKKNAVNKYFAFNALLHVWCNKCVFIMFYYSNKIKYSLVQVLLYLCVVYRASFTFL